MSVDKMLFVVGNSRSGTTMMGRILGNHPDVFTFGELHFFGQLWSPSYPSEMNKLKSVELATKLFCVQRSGYRKHGNFKSYVEVAQSFCETLTGYPITPTAVFSAFLQYETTLNGKNIPCDQTPRNVFYIDELLKCYPQARIINMIRDPRDVLLSQKRKWKRRFLGGTDLPIKETIRDWINYHPITISKIWQTAVSAADRFSDNNQILSIYFEQLLDNPDICVEKICQFAEIDYSSSLLQVPQVGSSINEDNVGQLGINPDRSGNWNDNREDVSNLDSSEIYICQRINDTLMKKHNYHPVVIRPNVFRLLVNLVSFPIKVVLAFLCNLDRIKNIRETLRRRL